MTRNQIEKMADAIATEYGVSRAGDVLMVPVVDAYRVRFWALAEEQRKNAAGHLFGTRIDLHAPYVESGDVDYIRERCANGCRALVDLLAVNGDPIAAGFREITEGE